MARRVLLLINPHARSGRENITRVGDALRAAGLDVLDASDEDKQPSESIFKHRNDVSAVVVGGGDGSMNAAVAALIETKLPLGIVPLGTANDLARTLEIPPDISKACDIIAAGHTRQIDVGWVNGRHFFNAASIGLSVEVTERLTKESKGRWGVFAYLATVVRVLRYARPFWVTIRRPGQPDENVRTVQVTVGNGRHYGGGMTVAKDAVIDDQTLNLLSLNVNHWWQLPPLLPALRSGHFDTWPRVLELTGTEFELIPSHPRQVNTDGELTTVTPAKFRVLPKAITVFAPTGG